MGKILAVAAIGALALGLWIGVQLLPSQAPVPGPPPLGGDFRLGRDGQRFSLAEHRGQVVAVYFGYTSCPDVCPTTLAVLASAIRQLEPAEQQRVTGVLVSVDPQRDTPERLRAYTQSFHPGFVGVSGSEAELLAITRQYGAIYFRTPPDANGNYSVDHTASLFLVGPDGKLAQRLSYGASRDETVAALRALLHAD